MTDQQTSRVTPGAGSQDVADFAVRVEGLSKTFPGQRALDDVTLEIRRGETHALVGQNGSGKSTLIKTLSGYHNPDPGSRCWLGGAEVTLGSLTEAQLATMKFVHQDLALIPTLSVQENLHLDRKGRGGLAPIERRRERADARDLLGMFKLKIPSDALVGSLRPFEKSAVAIVRALGYVQKDINLLVLDEPTASLGAVEARELFATLRHINEELGVAILYVSHFLSEILEIADRITVLRDGRRIAVVNAKSTTEHELIEHIVGDSVQAVEPPPPPPRAEDLLAVENLRSAVLENVTFSVGRGEVLGLTGLVGSGYDAVARALGGDEQWQSGSVRIGDHVHDHLDPRSAATAGIAAMPADRRQHGLIPQLTVAENVVLPDLSRNWRAAHLSRRREEREVRHWLDLTHVQPPDPTKRVDELSGGNQQKVMLAKALRLNPDILVLAEPTQAVDIGAAASIRNLITELAEAGHAVLVCSADGEELQEICHRVLVMRSGRIAAVLTGDDITEDRIAFESQFEEA